MSKIITCLGCGHDNFNYIQAKPKNYLKCVNCETIYEQTSPNFMSDMIEFMKCSRDDYKVEKNADIPIKLIKLRWNLIDEEVNTELLNQLNTLADLMHSSLPEDTDILESKADILDSIVDSVYVLLGTAVAFDLPFNEHWKEVHKKNMEKFPTNPPDIDYAPEGCVQISKIQESDRYRLVRADGKILKPVGWTPPDALAILKKHWGIQDGN